MRLVASDRKGVDQRVMGEVRYLGVAVSDGNMRRQVIHVYRVKSVSLHPRRAISPEQAGTTGTSDEPCWLFELGKSWILERPVINPNVRSFRIRLTPVDELERIQMWDDLPSRYRLVAEKHTT
ncbi:MAG: hypothetical protein HQL31_10680 [Planctomycetes bacterium]|nr:hypothetical protein [Planctomycetota bacterium]